MPFRNRCWWNSVLFGNNADSPLGHDSRKPNLYSRTRIPLHLCYLIWWCSAALRNTILCTTLDKARSTFDRSTFRNWSLKYTTTYVLFKFTEALTVKKGSFDFRFPTIATIWLSYIDKRLGVCILNYAIKKLNTRSREYDWNQEPFIGAKQPCHHALSLRKLPYLLDSATCIDLFSPVRCFTHFSVP